MALSATPTQLLLSLLLLALCCPPSQAAQRDMWRELGAHCDKSVWPNADTVPLIELDRCTRLTFAYRHPSTLKPETRARIARAMLQLYAAGTEEQAHLVLQAIRDFDVQSLPDRAPILTSEATGKLYKRAKCDVPPPSRASIKKAKAKLSKGIKLAKAGRYNEALERYVSMLDVAPGWPASHYNSAAMYARLDDEDNMVKHLFCLQDIASEDSARLLAKARNDPDFRGLRDVSKAFKAVTGYARVKIGNSLGERGEDNVDNIEASLNNLGFDVAAIKPTSKLYTAPRIWYRPEARLAAYITLQLLGHPKAKATPIDWDEREYDVILAWGDNLKKGAEPPLYVEHPDDAPGRMKDLRTAQNDMLRKPDRAVDKINKTLGTPGKVVDNAEDAVKRTERTLDKIKKIPDAIPGL